MRVSFLDLTRQHIEIKNDLSTALNRVIERGTFILGEEVSAFETEFAAYCGTCGAVGVASGTDALSLALIASDAVKKGRGDEVITTPLSAAYTALAILNAGAVPVFADIDPQTYTLNPNSIESLITEKTKAIIPVHLYGQIGDMKAIKEIARRHDLIVIEDAAQAHGAGKPTGQAAAFSFYPTKNLGACGDGGAIVSDDKDFLERVKLLRQGGHTKAIETEFEGRNSRLDEMQAAILRVKLKMLDKWTARRKTIANMYNESLKDIKGLQPPFFRDEDSHVFHLYVARHPERERIREELLRNGIETMIHYPYLLHQQKLFHRSTQPSLPNAEKIAKEIFSLPLYPQLSDDEIESIIEETRNAILSNRN